MSELTPPDYKRCQADTPGNGPFVMGGEVGDPRNGYRIRCRNPPIWIATEQKPGKDGQHGSMSLCDRCKGAMDEQLGDSFCVYAPILAPRKILAHLDHVECLEVATYGDNDSITVECTKCGCVVEELHNAEQAK